MKQHNHKKELDEALERLKIVKAIPAFKQKRTREIKRINEIIRNIDEKNKD